MSTKPQFSQHTFDCMRRVINQIKQRAVKQNDSETLGDVELVDALLLRFVEDLIMADVITVHSTSVNRPA